ncbi:hypothetical protein FB45DRAFT_208820 [Roridomyces roridus]|uniref:Uncharacterized protein n=1 Tax=Roridomyces roridus TaxID=1738132 RepID=A0AAD7CG52_9AGAR|nr:hypothetical protein FB45DRAFT_208820 [Roridomyces roridus]
MGRSCSMDDLRGRNHSRRLSLNIPCTAVLRDRASPPLCPPPSQRLSLQIQSPDSLPTIFRSSILEQAVPEEEEPTYPSPAITSPTICNASPRGRMAQFWETLDAEVDRESGGSSVPSLEIRDALRLALPNPPLPGPTPRARKLRKRVSSLALPQSHSESRFSIISTTSVGGRKLRKLRRPLSTTFMSKVSEPIPDLPSGLEQIGKGIGFTYKIPVASHSKASICSPAERSFAGRLFRSGLGLLRKAKSQQFSSAAGSGITRSRGPPAMIQTSHRFSSVAPSQGSPTSDGPLTPDSLSFPPLPEIQVSADPFAKDAATESPQLGGPDTTLRLVAVPPGNTLDFSSWDMY